jgi:hypothetical protein
MLIKVKKITDLEDGSKDIDFEADEEFVAWFKQKHNLKRWSQKRFEKFVVESLKNLAAKKKKEMEENEEGLES